VSAGICTVAVEVVGRHETVPALVSWHSSGRTLRLKCVVSTIASAKSGSTQKISKPTVTVRLPGGDQHREFTGSEELAVWAEVAVRFRSDSVVSRPDASASSAACGLPAPLSPMPKIETELPTDSRHLVSARA
jgi:hypothetical protein